MKLLSNLIFIFCLVNFGYMPSVIAQENSTQSNGVQSAQTMPKKPERKVPVKAPREVTYNKLNKIFELIGEERYDEALEDLNKLKGRVGKYPYELALVEHASGHIYAVKEQFSRSIASYRKAIELDVLENRVHFELMFSVAQLLYVSDKLPEALKALNDWFAIVSEPTDDGYVLAAILYQSLNRYRDAITNIKKAISVSDKPKEDWYRLLLFLHFELKEFSEATEVLELLVKMYPEKPDYWIQLSQLYMTLKRDDKALAVLGLAYRQSLLAKERDWMQLVNLYSYLKVPYKAAQRLDQGLQDGVVEKNKKHYELLGQFWYAARELMSAIDAYDQASSFADDGKLQMQRAYLLYDLDRFDEAFEAADKAIAKGGLRKPGDAYLIKGMSAFELGRVEQAKKAFSGALRYDKARKSANQWLQHIEEEFGQSS